MRRLLRWLRLCIDGGPFVTPNLKVVDYIDALVVAFLSVRNKPTRDK